MTPLTELAYLTRRLAYADSVAHAARKVIGPNATAADMRHLVFMELAYSDFLRLQPRPTVDAEPAPDARALHALARAARRERMIAAGPGRAS